MVAVLAACGAGTTDVHVVVVAVDTLRADHLGFHGYPRPTSPRMDALARDGVVFEQAISQSSWTLPAFASILTGLLPRNHRAGEGKVCLSGACGALGAAFPTLGELLGKAGYRTASFVSNGFVAEGVGLGRGFETRELRVLGALAVEEAVRWLEVHRDEPRLFLFAHVIEPHGPYEPTPEDAALFVDPGYAGPVTPATASVADPAWTDADRRRVRDLYDGEVRGADRIVGRLLDTLVTLGLDERTLVVLVSDHGEELFEHGRLGHGHSMYDELLHVPLVLRFPGGARRGRVARQVRTMDVFPTILEVAGVPVPEDVDGRSLLPLVGDAAPSFPDAAIAEFTYAGPELKAVRRTTEKLVVEMGSANVRLFDLAADPGEQHDRAGEDPEAAARLRHVLATTGRTSPPGLYLTARGGTKPQRVSAALVTAGEPFADVEVQSGEAGDVAGLLPDRRRCTIVLTLDPGDEDVVRVGLPAEGAKVSVQVLAIDGRPVEARSLLVGAGLPLPRERPPFVLDETRARVDRMAVPAPGIDGAARVALQVVRPVGPPTIAIDDDTRRQLRALGYAE